MHDSLINQSKNRARDLLHCVLLILAIWAVYSQCLEFEFVLWDDDIHISANKLMHAPSSESLKTLIEKPFFGLYIPVTYSFWLMLAWISGLSSSSPGPDPTVFHLANIILHTGNVCLVYALARKLTISSMAALAAALVFALHPLQVEAVAWVSGAKDLLSSTSSFLALHFLLGKKSLYGWARALLVPSLFLFLRSLLNLLPLYCH